MQFTFVISLDLEQYKIMTFVIHNYVSLGDKVLSW